MTFSNDNCFLCGATLENHKSDEHVFPKWIQEKCNLWDKKMTLLNGTDIPYRQLTIPCCSQCNNEHLSILEKSISSAHGKGYCEFCKVEELRIYQWITKIFYGLLFKELSLNADRSNPKLGKITTPEFLKELEILLRFLQSIILPIKFDNFRPWSLFVYKVHSLGDESDFNYHDDIMGLTFSIRFGGIGIIAFLQDNGIQKEMKPNFFNKFNNITLHPMQFEELSAIAYYKSTLMNRTPKYMFVSSDDDTELQEIKVFTNPLQGLSEKPIFDEWDNEIYAKILALFLRPYAIDYEDIYGVAGKILTFLTNPDGTPNVIEFGSQLLDEEPDKQ